MLYEMGTGLARLQFTLFARWIVEGRESIPPRGPLIVAANHLSNADPPVAVASFNRKLHCLAKEGTVRNPHQPLVLHQLPRPPRPRRQGGAESPPLGVERLG